MNDKQTIWRIFMRTSLLLSLLIFSLFAVKASNLYAQTLATKIDIQFPQGDLKSAIQHLQKVTSLNFAYDDNYLSLEKKRISARKYEQQAIGYIIADLLYNSDITFKQQAANIVLFKKVNGILRGTINDESGQILPGATIKLAGTNYVAIANQDGYYELSAQEGTYTLEISFVGYETVSQKKCIN